MKVILKDYVKGFGDKNDIVEVKNGYGRNYLIPQGLATIATPSAIKMANENVKQAAHKQAKVKTDAEAQAAKLKDIKITIPTKAGSNGKIFGSVTILQLAKSLADRGFEVDKRKISAPDMKNIGAYKASINLHKEVSVEIDVDVIQE
ncbi:MAG: 50S ribosomal protein L9 [Bacteroidia bacterium]|jgi:large subunit ribosomal protein L9|nr:50S ribosomal protein L9 [Bacteroidia bacterium]|tara:strand:+ start:7480 stop:7920 length:441 start_codon:yes stop_codon:yes gene_type:complete